MVFGGVSYVGMLCVNPRRIHGIGGDSDYCDGRLIHLEVEIIKLA
jgi:hypothetical protein